MIILINISRLRSNCGESGAYSATAEDQPHTAAGAASLSSGSWAQLLHIVRLNVTIRRSSVIPLLLWHPGCLFSLKTSLMEELRWGGAAALLTVWSISLIFQPRSVSGLHFTADASLSPGLGSAWRPWRNSPEIGTGNLEPGRKLNNSGKENSTHLRLTCHFTT